MVFPVVMYGCESWTIKRAECGITDVFKFWCWERLLKVPWTARRSKQSILKIISPEYSLEGLMLKLKLWPPDVKNWPIEKTQMVGKIVDGRRRGQQRMRWWMASPTRWTCVWINSRSWWWTGKPDVLQSMASQSIGHDCATELNWTAHNRETHPAQWT